MFTKLELATMIANLVNIAICVHVALTVMDHNPVASYYFPVISLGLILNGIGAFFIANRSTK
jgi:hypothetical protein